MSILPDDIDFDSPYQDDSKRILELEEIIQAMAGTLTELEQKLKVSKEAQQYSHDNLMILERDRQKAWDKTKELQLQADCGYEHAHGVTCKKCGWYYYE